MRFYSWRIIKRRKGQNKKDIPRIELGLLDSKSNVLTITPYVLVCHLAYASVKIRFFLIPVRFKNWLDVFIYKRYFNIDCTLDWYNRNYTKISIRGSVNRMGLRLGGWSSFRRSWEAWLASLRRACCLMRRLRTWKLCRRRVDLWREWVWVLVIFTCCWFAVWGCGYFPCRRCCWGAVLVIEWTWVMIKQTKKNYYNKTSIWN